MPIKEELWNRSKDVLVIIVIPATIWITSSIFELQHKASATDTALKSTTETLTAIDEGYSIAISRIDSVHNDTRNLNIETSRLHGELQILESKYDDLDNKRESLEVKITRLESKMESMSSDIQEIKTMVQTLINK